MASKKTLQAIALMGATGSGKSSLAMRLAESSSESVGTSIISCDSMQLYRGLNIGTAKASADEQARVKHHLIDCADLSEIWSAQHWANAAEAVIKSENEAGRIPLIVGGTGLYLKALIEGFADIPKVHPDVREKYESMQKELGTPRLYAVLMQKDHELAKKLSENDTQRILRGLCVFESSGVALSEWQQQEKQHKDIDCSVFVLDVERDTLRERIASRFEQMMDAGWQNETTWLLKQKLADTHPAMRAVGYRQLLDFLNEKCTLEQAIQDGITATRRYAKRQKTWFRNQVPNAFFGDADALLNNLNPNKMTG